MTLVQSEGELMANAFSFADALRTGDTERTKALHLLSAGRVYLPFRYGQHLAFAPAKYIGYTANDLGTYQETAQDRHGSRARDAVSRLLGYKAAQNEELERQLENFCLRLGVPLHENRHTFWLNGTAKSYLTRDPSAISDLDGDDLGNDDPEYRKRMAGAYFRDQKVRLAVLDRAAGCYEHCGQPGFQSLSGKPFLETHHIISLSEQGRDKQSNVIALCPNDHRRAHFGSDWKELQDTFLAIVQKKMAL
jgi:hypothetical protein